MADEPSAGKPGEGAGTAPTDNAPESGKPEGGAAPTDAPKNPPEKKPENPADKPSTDAGDDEPQVRKTKLDYILQRKERKLERQKSDQIKKIDQALGDDPADKPEGEDDQISPDDEQLVEKVVEKKFGTHLRAIEDQQFDAEIKNFLADPENEVFKPYEAKIRKFAAHDSRRHIPLKSIAYEVAGPDLMRLGAKKAQQADEEAAKSTTGGGSTRNEPASKKVADMTSAEFEEHVQKVKRGEAK